MMTRGMRAFQQVVMPVGSGKLSQRRARWPVRGLATTIRGKPTFQRGKAFDDEPELDLAKVKNLRVINVDDDFDLDAALEDDDDDFDDDFKAQNMVARKSMAARLEAAENSGGRIKGYTDDIAIEEDEPEERSSFYIDVQKTHCPGCGAKFQSTDDGKPGFLPRHVFEEMGLVDDVSSVDDDEESVAKEVEMLLREARGEVIEDDHVVVVEDAEDDMVTEDDTLVKAKEVEEKEKADALMKEHIRRYEEMFLSEADREPIEVDDLPTSMLIGDREKQVICQRCHALRHQSATALRAKLDAPVADGLSAAAFEEMLRTTVKEAKGVVVLFVDFFDVDASLRGWSQIRQLIGGKRMSRRKVLIAANKFDLLPTDVPRARAIEWVRRATLHYIPALRDQLKPADVFLISAKTGLGVKRLLEDARRDADKLHGDVYIVGAANAGKSTFINRAIGAWSAEKAKKLRKKAKKQLLKGKKKPKDDVVANPVVFGLTASATPGTTLSVVRVAGGDGDSNAVLYDTPGLLTGDSLTTILTNDELKAVLPSKPMNPTCLRVEPGKAVLLGGFASVQLLEADLGAFFLTFCVSDKVSLHPTSFGHNRTFDTFAESHVGTDILKPPYSVDRFKDLRKLMTTTDIPIQGQGWDAAAADIVLSGLGWFSVTGSGPCTIRIDAPSPILVRPRDPLLPFEANIARSKFTGGRFLGKRSGGGGSSGGGSGRPSRRR